MCVFVESKMWPLPAVVRPTCFPNRAPLSNCKREGSVIALTSHVAVIRERRARCDTPPLRYMLAPCGERRGGLRQLHFTSAW